MWSSRWRENWHGEPTFSAKIHPNSTLTTTNPTQSDLVSNPDRRGGVVYYLWDVDLHAMASFCEHCGCSPFSIQCSSLWLIDVAGERGALQYNTLLSTSVDHFVRWGRNTGLRWIAHLCQLKRGASIISWVGAPIYTAVVVARFNGWR
jgi:hypothetical protein